MMLLKVYLSNTSGATLKYFIRVMRRENNPVIFFVACISEVASIIAIIFIWRKYNKGKFYEMGLSLKHAIPKFLIGMAAGIGSISLIFGVFIITGLATIQKVRFHYLGSTDFWIYVVVFIIVGFYEEVLFRGYWMSVLKKSRNVIFIILCSAFLFSLIHAPNDGASVLGIFNLFLQGIIFALMLKKTGSIFMSSGYIIVWNFFEGCIYGFTVSGTANKSLITTSISGNDLFTGGGFGAEGSLITTVLFAAEILILFYLVKDSKGEHLWTPNITEKSKLA